MEIYIESIFILNFLLDFMILYGTKRLLKRVVPIYRLFIGSMVGSFTTFFIYVNSNGLLFILKIIFSIFIILISFGYKDFIKNIFYFYLISILLGGVFYLLDFNKSYYYNFILLIIIFPIIIYIIIREFINYRININNKYLVEIIINKKLYKFEGLLDTGNNLKSPISNKPVILVDINIDRNRVIYIPYKALNYEGVIECIRPDAVIINKREINNCLVGLANNKFSLGGVNCILPNILKEELC